MMKLFAANPLGDLLHLFFPHNCMGCGNGIDEIETLLCAECSSQLPETAFFNHDNNPVEKIFYGRMKTEQAGSAFFFNKDSVIQHLITQLKYKNSRETGLYLGRLLGHKIKECGRFENTECIVPLPLNEVKHHTRGYNQSALIAQGITEIWPRDIFENAVMRKVFTETQTHKGRISRWQTMEGVFTVRDNKLLEGRHVLLVDDIITTGATLEACGLELLKVQGLALSIATVAYTL